MSGVRKGRERVSGPDSNKGLLAGESPIRDNLGFLSVAVGQYSQCCESGATDGFQAGLDMVHVGEASLEE
jgi:hypothetical protein